MPNDVIENTAANKKRSREDDYESNTVSSSVAMLDQGTEIAYRKYRKLANTTDPNYLCTMDNFMHSYSNHRNVTNASQQFAYCFN